MNKYKVGDIVRRKVEHLNPSLGSRIRAGQEFIVAGTTKSGVLDSHDTYHSVRNIELVIPAGTALTEDNMRTSTDEAGFHVWQEAPGKTSQALSVGDIVSDPVNHPSHYKSNGYEAIEVMEAFNLHRDGRLFNGGKYILRAGQKDKESQDIRKAIWYLDRYAEDLEAQGK